MSTIFKMLAPYAFSWYTLFQMGSIEAVLPFIQIVLSILLVAAIILQQRGSSLGGAFGGDNFHSTYSTRRGLEKWLFYASIVLGVLFALSTFVALVI